MGQAALQPGALERLPDPVDESTALTFLDKCFDRADWEMISGGTGQVSKNIFITTLEVRNHPSSLLGWLEMWRIDELLDFLENELDVCSPADVAELGLNDLNKLDLKAVQRRHFQKAMAHAEYLKFHDLDKPPSPLMLWLEAWRLQRLQPALFDLGVDVKEDIVDLDGYHERDLNMKLLEAKRWKRATASLLDTIRDFDFSSDRKYAAPTISVWLESLRLTKIRGILEEYGAYELCDLADIEERELNTLGLTLLQLKHFRQGMIQVKAAQAKAMSDGKSDLPSFRGFLESWRLARLLPKMEDLGAYHQLDLLDLDPDDFRLIEMRPLEAKRFEQCMVALEEEFLGPNGMTLPPTSPMDGVGDTWGFETMESAAKSRTKMVQPKSKSRTKNFETASFDGEGSILGTLEKHDRRQFNRSRPGTAESRRSRPGTAETPQSGRRSARETSRSARGDAYERSATGDPEATTGRRRRRRR